MFQFYSKFIKDTFGFFYFVLVTSYKCYLHRIILHYIFNCKLIYKFH